MIVAGLEEEEGEGEGEGENEEENEGERIHCSRKLSRASTIVSSLCLKSCT